MAAITAEVTKDTGVSTTAKSNRARLVMPTSVVSHTPDARPSSARAASVVELDRIDFLLDSYLSAAYNDLEKNVVMLRRLAAT